ncbi:nuclear transport factor 2 family protein [Streptomyces sp. NPDC048172]|uniref:nuclear transport factor 2 family protein n=1 Tax=Streptomyces sp. NPDC048172 TaxID=3365505 RepID=UPI0037240D62
MTVESDTGTDTGTGTGELEDFGRRWAKAERERDTDALEALLAQDFQAVGPRGFLVDREQWLDRYASGALVHDAFTWEDVELRRYGDGAVALGVQSQQSTYDGRDVDGHFRVTQYLTRVSGVWQLAGLHLSPIAGTPAG